MGPWAARIIGLAFIVVSSPCVAQVKDIDATKLPQSPAVQAAYRSAQDLERFADTWTVNWNYAIPKTQVQDKLADDLGILNRLSKPTHPTTSFNSSPASSRTSPTTSTTKPPFKSQPTT